MSRKPLRVVSGAELIQALRKQGRDAQGVPEGLEGIERTAFLKSQEPIMSEETKPVVSPTGTPLLPPKWMALATLIVAAGAVLAIWNFIPSSDIDEKIGQAILALGAVVGIASPGIRK